MVPSPIVAGGNGLQIACNLLSSQKVSILLSRRFISTAILRLVKWTDCLAIQSARPASEQCGHSTAHFGHKPCTSVLSDSQQQLCIWTVGCKDRASDLAKYSNLSDVH